MKRLVLLFVFLSLYCGYSSAVEFDYSTGGDGFVSAEEYYQSSMNGFGGAGLGVSKAPMDEDDDDDDDRPGHTGDVPQEDVPVPEGPIGPLPFAFLALIAGGYVALKRVRRQ